MAKALNRKKRLRALEAAKAPLRRNFMALNAMMRRCPKLDKKKQAAKLACRQPIPE